MSSSNAFATAHNNRSFNGGGHEDQHDALEPPKRQRMSDALDATMARPYAQSEVSLEVDIMILDFLAFDAAKALLESRKPPGTGFSPGSLGGKLQLVNSFTAIFKARHQRYKADAELRLRLLLLKMATLFTQRYTLNPTTPEKSSLQALRKANRERAEAWIGGDGDREILSIWELSPFIDCPSISVGSLESNRAHVLHQLGIPAEDEDYEDAFYGTASCVSLLDILPLFMEVSAASSSIHGSIVTPRWMRLAVEFMLQACLEQYLVCGHRGRELFDEAFSWGYKEAWEKNSTTESVGEGGGLDKINEMFEDDTYTTEVDGWHRLKLEIASELAQCGDVEQLDNDGATRPPDVAQHLENVAARRPIDIFEASVLKLMDALSASIAPPVLVQLENGQLDGMTQDETKDFLTQCGVKLSRT